MWLLRSKKLEEIDSFFNNIDNFVITHIFAILQKYIHITHICVGFVDEGLTLQRSNLQFATEHVSVTCNYVNLKLINTIKYFITHQGSLTSLEASSLLFHTLDQHQGNFPVIWNNGSYFRLLVTCRPICRMKNGPQWANGRRTISVLHIFLLYTSGEGCGELMHSVLFLLLLVYFCYLRSS